MEAPDQAVLDLAQRMREQLDGISEHDALRASALAVAVIGDNARALARGLLEIAELAMPDTYLQTDSRCQLARKVLGAPNAVSPAFEAAELQVSTNSPERTIT